MVNAERRIRVEQALKRERESFFSAGTSMCRALETARGITAPAGVRGTAGESRRGHRFATRAAGGASVAGTRGVCATVAAASAAATWNSCEGLSLRR